MSVVDSFEEGNAAQIDHRVSSYRVSYILHAEIIEFHLGSHDTIFKN